MKELPFWISDNPIQGVTWDEFGARRWACAAKSFHALDEKTKREAIELLPEISEDIERKIRLV